MQPVMNCLKTETLSWKHLNSHLSENMFNWQVLTMKIADTINEGIPQFRKASHRSIQANLFLVRNRNWNWFTKRRKEVFWYIRWNYSQPFLLIPLSKLCLKLFYDNGRSAETNPKRPVLCTKKRHFLRIC